MLTRWPVIGEAAGAAMALAAGLTLGSYMKPQLVTDQALGPHMLAPVSAQRAGDPIDDGATLARYGGKIPDYVLGTDVTRPMVAEAAPAAEPEPEPAPLEVDRTTYEAPEATPPDYPSSNGAIADGSDGPSPAAG